MSNFIPGNYPSPDQDNVYYNIQAVIARMRGNLLDETLDLLSIQLFEYQLPTFVLDETNAPNSYLVKIYPKDGPDGQIYVSDASVTDASVTTSSPPMIDTSPENMDDGCIPVVLDPRFHSNSRIKEGDFSFVDDIEPSWKNTCILISATKFVHSKDVVEKNNQNAEIVRNIVSNQLVNLPEDLKNEYVEMYEDTVEKIEELLLTLQRVVDGEKETIDKIADTLVQDAYYGSNTPSGQLSIIQDPENRRKLSSKYIGTAFWQLARSSIGGSSSASTQEPYAGYFTTPTEMLDTTATSPTSISNATQTYVGNDDPPVVLNKASRFWKSFLKSPDLNLDINGDSSTTLLNETDLKFDTTNPTSWIEKLLNYTSGTQSKDTFDPIDGWMKTWYYDNLSDQIEKKQVNFESMDDYISEFTNRLNEIKESANVFALEGNCLTVIQSIIRAIVKLCQNNLDVSKYAPLYNQSLKNQYGSNPYVPQGTSILTPLEGYTFFQAIGRSSILGVSGAHPSPSKYSNIMPDEVGEGDNAINLNDIIDPVQNYSNNAFLNFNGLITILNTFNQGAASSRSSDGLPSVRENLIKNIQTLDSNHDSVIKLWELVSIDAITQKQNFHHGLYYFNSVTDLTSEQREYHRDNTFYTEVDEGPKSVRDLAHLFKINQNFHAERLYLLAKTPRVFGAPPNLRSFFSYRMEPIPFWDWWFRNINIRGGLNSEQLARQIWDNHDELIANQYPEDSILPISDGSAGTGSGEHGANPGTVDHSLLSTGDAYTQMGYTQTYGEVESSVPDGGTQVELQPEDTGGGGRNYGAPAWMTGMPEGWQIGDDLKDEEGVNTTEPASSTIQGEDPDDPNIPPQ